MANMMKIESRGAVVKVWDSNVDGSTVWLSVGDAFDQQIALNVDDAERLAAVLGAAVQRSRARK